MGRGVWTSEFLLSMSFIVGAFALVFLFAWRDKLDAMTAVGILTTAAGVAGKYSHDRTALKKVDVTIEKESQ